MAEKKEDASKRILLIILIIIIFVSVLGTWTILSAIDSVQSRPPVMQVTKIVQQGPPLSGQVALEILPPKESTETKESGKGE